MRRRWTTMPDCEIVKLRNTPIAYSGIRAVVLAFIRITSSEARMASSTMPQEKTSRPPRKLSWRGR